MREGERERKGGWVHSRSDSWAGGPINPSHPLGLQVDPHPGPTENSIKGSSVFWMLKLYPQCVGASERGLESCGGFWD